MLFLVRVRHLPRNYIEDVACDNAIEPEREGRRVA